METEAAALLRSTLAARRVLLLLDNAHNADQVRPLLSGGEANLVLVTSRNDLTGLIAREGARRLTLNVLAEAESIALLRQIIGAPRTDADPAAAAGLAAACGHLPLALRIAGALLAGQPHIGLRDYVSGLAPGSRLTEFAVEGDPQSAVRTVFDFWYRGLSALECETFRLIGLIPGESFTAEAIAALAGQDAAQVERRLRRLHADHLIESPARERYSTHDLLRLYAGERADSEIPAASRAEAQTRLMHFYLGRVNAAARLLYPQMLRLPAGAAFPTPPLFQSPAEASGWLDTERSALIASVRDATERGDHELALRLADALRGYLWIRHDTLPWVQVARCALASAEAVGDGFGVVSALISLAHAYHGMGRYAEASEFYQRCLPVAREVGWLEGEGTALANLGIVHIDLGELPEAIRCSERALAIHEDLGNEAGQAVIRGGLGIACLVAGALHDALGHLTKAVEQQRASGATGMLVMSLSHLGDTYRQLGDTARATTLLEEAAALATAVGSIGGKAVNSYYLATLHLDLGQTGRALDLAHEAVEVSRSTGDTATMAYALITLGNVHLRSGRYREAGDAYAEALTMSREAGQPHQACQALIGLSRTQLAAERVAQARELAEQALRLARERHFAACEAEAVALAGN
jgi:tetratricopeptide (TPR) repeat protein